MMEVLSTELERVLKSVFGEDRFRNLAALVPEEMQGFGGVLRGTFRLDDSVTVRLQVRPWDSDEKWQAMVQGRRLGENAFFDQWFPTSSIARIPFLSLDFTSQCGICGEEPCWHAGSLVWNWLGRAADRPELVLLLLNRHGLIRTMNANSRAVSRVPNALGTNLDRTRKELIAIVEAAVKKAQEERDNLFGQRGDHHAHPSHRD